MKRLYLTEREYQALLAKQDGMCCIPWCDETKNLIGEHSTPNKWKQAKPDQLMCVACHKSKTRRDIKAIWKVRRLNGETLGQYERRKRYGAQIKSRGFDSSSRKRRGDRPNHRPIRQSD